MEDERRLLDRGVAALPLDGSSTAAGGGAAVAAVALEGVSRCFVSASETVWAVRDASFAVEEGRFVCLFGASGSGKSTLLNLIAGLDSATAGSIMVGGVDVGALGEDRRARLRLERIGVVFQDHNLIEEFTAVENVMLSVRGSGRWGV